MIVLILCLLFFLILLKMNKRVIKVDYKILNPVSLIIYVWILVFVCHYYYWPDSDGSIYFISFLGVCSLSVGFWLTTPSSMKSVSNNQKIEYNPIFVKRSLNLFLLLDILRLLFCTYLIVYKIAGGNWFMLLNESSALRGDYLAYEDSLIEKLFGFLGNLLAYIGFIILGIYIAQKREKRWYYLFFISVIELGLAVVTMSKLSFSLEDLQLYVREKE